MLDAVIFDMDGVIFDSERKVVECWQEIAAKYNIQGIEDVCQKCLGTTYAVTRLIMLEHYGEDFPYEEYKAEASALYHERYDGGRLPMKPYIKELLEWLKINNIKTAVASSTRSEVVISQLKDAGLFDYYDAVIGGDMVQASKPAPDIFLRACEELKVSPINAYGIEDSYNGIRSLSAAGMHPIMVPDMAPPTDEMEGLAEVILPSLKEVTEYLEKELLSGPMNELAANSPDIIPIIRMFYDSELVSCETINTSHGSKDFREVVIAELSSGETVVIKLADNSFTSPDRIKMWQRTVAEYRSLGYYCPAILTDKNGSFPTVSYRGRRCIAYAEEYSPYRPAEYRVTNDSEENKVSSDKYLDEAWIMTTKIASKHFSYTEYPSCYCLFEKFCADDKYDEVLEDALEWKTNADALPDEFQPQILRIWQLWWENRNKLEPLYKQLPSSVFQADLNSTNILVDEDKFVGVFDFNLCGKEVFLNYIFRETFTYEYKEEIEMLLKRLRFIRGYYTFTDEEKQAALMLYRCLKPLKYSKAVKLKEIKDDPAEVRKFLDETEQFLTKDIDFESCMTAE